MPEGMRKLVRDLRRVPVAIGDGVKRPLPSEEQPLAEDGQEARRRARPRRRATCSPTATSSRSRLPTAGCRRTRSTTCSAACSPRARRGGGDPRRRRRPSCATARVASGASARRAVRVTAPADDELRAVGLVVFDFDGVFTDNRVWVSETGEESVACWRGDGIGLRRLDEVGVAARDRLDRDESRRGAKGGEAPDSRSPRSRRQARGRTGGGRAPRPRSRSRRLCRERRQRRGVPRGSRVPVVPADAWPEVVPLARWVLERSGGRGCVREVCDVVWRAHAAPDALGASGAGSSGDGSRLGPEHGSARVHALRRRPAQRRGGQRPAARRSSAGRSRGDHGPMGGDSRRRRERRCDVHARRRAPRLGRALQGDPALTQLRAPGRAVGGARPGHR